MYIYQAVEANLVQFIEFWSQRYEYAREDLYNNNIGLELTEQRITDLYLWKNGTPLSERKRNSVAVNFSARRHELEKFQSTFNVREFLNHFEHGGAIWRIFWLHCHRPNQYPIYDQHVHRAMAIIQTGEREEIPQYDPRKIETYIERYIPFYGQFLTDSIEMRAVDKALWAFGKFINENNSPIPV